MGGLGSSLGVRPGMKMSVRRQILLAQVLPLLPMALVGLVTVFALVQVGRTAREIRTEGLNRIDLTERAMSLLEEEEALLSEYHEGGEKETHRSAIERSAALREIVDEIEAVSGVGSDLSVDLDAFEQAAGLSDSNFEPEEARERAQSLQRSLADLKEIFRYDVEVSMEAVARSGRITAVGVVLAVGFLLLVSLVAGRLLSRRLLESLKLLEQGTEQVARGEYESRIRLGGDDEFGRLARAFNRMADRIGALDRMKVDFFANISHDLKTPLTSLIEAVELLDEGVPGPLTPGQKRLVQVSRESALRLKALVGNVLDVSKLGAQEVARSRGDILAVVYSTLDELELLAIRKSVHLERTGHDRVPELLVNRGMLEQVLMNLVGNAIRFSPKGGTVRIHVVSEENEVENGRLDVRVEVSDEGPGIPEEWRERVFRRFTQVPRDGEQTGTGLGLYISRQIVHAHGGQIGVDTAAGGGCMLWFSLPLADQT